MFGPSSALTLKQVTLTALVIHDVSRKQRFFQSKVQKLLLLNELLTSWQSEAAIGKIASRVEQQKRK